MSGSAPDGRDTAAAGRFGWRRAGTVISSALVLFVALVFLLEEVLWDLFGRVMAAIGRWPPLARAEAAIGRLPPYGALALFAVPVAVIWPLKLFALWLIALGDVRIGVVLFSSSELIGAAILAHLYRLCRPALHQLAWLVAIETVVLRISAWAHARVDRLEVWQRARRMVRGVVTRVRGWRARLSFRF